jgi:hypothetical protein
MLGNYRLDWAQEQGRRDPSMVNYYGESWHFTGGSTGSRFGPGVSIVFLFLKLKVRPVQGADLNRKRVGVVYRTASLFVDVTAVGSYFTTLADGYEEWHVLVSQSSWEGAITFTAWYQDGQGNTFYDDNGGERHVATSRIDDSEFIDQLPSTTNIALTQAGVQGRVTIRLADLAFAKDVGMVATTDNWANVRRFGMGPAGSPNAWQWVRDDTPSSEQWEIALQIPGDFQRFEYAMFYRHGIVPGVRSYTFWASRRGANYVVVRT